ncbi:hypothetical protein [Alkalihalobacterium bogoriense]|uniref:hypothetical protein n=1 Tax=Alkalihalobacterium bogoriense TaxID=246272 RepID=UPI0005568EBF|nr:hypothetical protein [Alkalihalobacterium bogoriense]
MKFIRYTWLLLSGVWVLLFSLWMSGPGIAETDTPEYRLQFMLLFVLWVVGFVLQMKEKRRVLGIVLTIIAAAFYVVLMV